MEQNFKEQFYVRVYNYGREIVKLVESLPRDNASNILGAQLLRSGTSVPANIIEAKAASSKKDYANFYNHALKSANESKLWIGYLRDAEKIDGENARRLLGETHEIANILAASLLTMRGKRKI